VIINTTYLYNIILTIIYISCLFYIDQDYRVDAWYTADIVRNDASIYAFIYDVGHCLSRGVHCTAPLQRYLYYIEPYLKKKNHHRDRV